MKVNRGLYWLVLNPARMVAYSDRRLLNYFGMVRWDLGRGAWVANRRQFYEEVCFGTAEEAVLHLEAIYALER